LPEIQPNAALLTELPAESLEGKNAAARHEKLGKGFYEYLALHLSAPIEQKYANGKRCNSNVSRGSLCLQSEL
jgi:hypothetical protein